MMNFHSAKKKKQNQKQGISFLFVVVLVALGFSGMYRWLSTGFSPLALSFWQFREGGTTSLSFVLKDKYHLEKRVEELEQKLEAKELEVLRLEMFRDENEKLKQSLTTLSSYNPKTASILVKPNYTLYDTMIVDAGEKDGVREGDMVVAYGSVLIGKIVDVQKNISHVELFTENEATSLLVHTKSGTYVDAVGHGSQMVAFTLPRDVSIAVGDALSFPARVGFLFGTIEHIGFDATDPVQTILARSAVNLHQLQFVEIISGYEEQF